MPVSFKPPVDVIAFLRTPEADLIECDTPGCGYNPQGQVAINPHDPVCSGTGFKNFYTQIPIEGYLLDPREVRVWNQVEGGYTFLGQVGIKFEPKYAAIVDSAAFLRYNGVDFNFLSLSERGTGIGNDRQAYALTRK